MKAIELLRSISKELGSEELNAALQASDLKEVDISDDEAGKITKKFGSFVTVDDAVNNPTVYKAFMEREMNSNDSELHRKIKGDVLTKKERALREKYGDLVKDAERLDDMIDKIASNKSGGNNKQVEELSAAYEKANREAAQIREQFDQFKQQSTAKERELREEFAFDNYLSKYTLADPYKDDMVRQGIISGIKQSVKNQARLAIGDNNQLDLRDRDNPDLKFHKDNKPAGLDDVVGPLIAPYLKKSNDKGSGSVPNVKADTGDTNQNLNGWQRARRDKQIPDKIISL